MNKIPDLKGWFREPGGMGEALGEEGSWVPNWDARGWFETRKLDSIEAALGLTKALTVRDLQFPVHAYAAYEFIRVTDETKRAWLFPRFEVALRSLSVLQANVPVAYNSHGHKMEPLVVVTACLNQRGARFDAVVLFRVFDPLENANEAAYFKVRQALLAEM